MNLVEPWSWVFSHGQGSRPPLVRSERGASAVEYGLLIAGIAALIAGVVFAFGGGTNGLFHGSCRTILEETSTGSCE